jgi:DTW domain-containing protein YfiP
VACWCEALRPIDSRCRVLILQHPRERRKAIGTARMAHLGLPNSELYCGIEFERHERVRALVDGAVLLFPGPGTVPPGALRHDAPPVLVVLDGTWSQARALYWSNPFLQALPRVGFVPPRPSEYLIRREPAPHCVSTIEAVAYALGEIEGDATRFAPLLAPFRRMVAWQCRYDESARAEAAAAAAA